MAIAEVLFITGIFGIVVFFLGFGIVKIARWLDEQSENDR